MKNAWMVGAALSATLLAGCSNDEKPKPLAPSAFSGGRRIPTEPQSAVDQPGVLSNNGERTGTDVERPRTPVGPGVERVSRTVQENVKAPGQAILERAATQTAAAASPTTRGSSGQYMIIGGVVAEVNGTPIYANRVVSTLEPVLSARAPSLDERTFRAFARDEIGRQIMEFCYAEREVAAAQRFLDEKDKQLAEGLAGQWRQRQITESGGSLELARKNATEIARKNHLPDDLSFEDLVQFRHRLYLTQLYYERKIMPRIQPTATEIRQFYDKHQNDQFTDHGQAQFRVIKIDPKNVGGREAALKKIQELRERAVKGEDFEAMAGSINHDPRLLKARGDLGVGMVQRGTLSPPYDKVEEAVWKIQVGEVADIIDTGDAFYLAKLENRKPGRVIPFEEQETQDKIRGALRSEQFRMQREEVQKKLMKDSVLRFNEEMMSIAVDMAMERYPRWAAAKVKSQ